MTPVLVGAGLVPALFAKAFGLGRVTTRVAILTQYTHLSGRVAPTGVMR